jgi:hypothetical protein
MNRLATWLAGQTAGTLRGLLLRDAITAYQLVGGVMAYQGDDG